MPITVRGKTLTRCCFPERLGFVGCTETGCCGIACGPAVPSLKLVVAFKPVAFSTKQCVPSRFTYCLEIPEETKQQQIVAPRLLLTTLVECVMTFNSQRWPRRTMVRIVMIQGCIFPIQKSSQEWYCNFHLQRLLPREHLQKLVGSLCFPFHAVVSELSTTLYGIVFLLAFCCSRRKKVCLPTWFFLPFARKR